MVLSKKKVCRATSFCSIKYMVNTKEEDSKARATNTTKEMIFLTLAKSLLKQEQEPLREDPAKEESLCGYLLGLQLATLAHVFFTLSRVLVLGEEEVEGEKAQ